VQIAQAEGSLRAARSFVLETLTTVWDDVAAGRPVSLEQRALLRLAATHASESAARAVDLMFNTGGSSSLFTSNPLERAFRDVHAVTQHIFVQQASYEQIGRTLLGADPGPLF
jgi:alkylation response protein AidB-like acyl-CoA dehydrogenase